MKIIIHGVPRFSFQLSEDEVNLLIKMALRHYDIASKWEAGPDGVLIRWRNALRNAAEIREIQGEGEEPYYVLLEATSRELDKIAKICEPINTMGLDEDEKATVNRIYLAFMNALAKANHHYSDWVDVINGAH